MTTNPAPTVRSGFVCGACSHGNSEAAQFCAGCGQALFEPCGSCSQPARLEQKFCGGCGTNLQEKRDRQKDQYQIWLVSSVEAAKKSEFDQAIGLLSRVAGDKDYRYAEWSQQASAALEKIEKLKKQRTEAVDALIAQAEVAFKADEKSVVIDLLSRVPEAMRTPDVRTMLESCSAFLAQVNELEAKLQSQLADKNYDSVAGTIEVLLGLVPNNETYRKLGRKVTEKLLSSSQRRFDTQDYTGAASKLAAVPAQMRDERYESARQLIENVEWLERQFDSEPFATSTLGRLAVRFEKESPQNEGAKRNTKELLQKMKQPLADPRNPYNAWRGECKSWIGGKLGYLGYPATVPVANDENMRRQPGRFHVAIGLALQGVGLGIVDEGFAIKKARFTLLQNKKPKLSWGVDIGTSGIRAVLVQWDKEELTILESYSDDFEAPTSRMGCDIAAPEVIRAAVTKFLEASTNHEAPYWVNLPAGDTIARFVRLPPVKDKVADDLMKQEAHARIPMPPESLDYVIWIGKQEPDSAHGRPGFVCAAKKSAVMSRTDLLASAGMKISGMQSDQVALVNFASREFAAVLNEVSEEEASLLPTVALIDAGATFSTLVLISHESFWFWSIESGGEDLTSALARGTRKTHGESEQLKRFPAKIEHPRDGYEPVEKKLDEFRSRLQKLAAEGVNQNGRFQVTETWCFGGSAMTHSWVRRVLLSE